MCSKAQDIQKQPAVLTGQDCTKAFLLAGACEALCRPLSETGMTSMSLALGQSWHMSLPGYMQRCQHALTWQAAMLGATQVLA